MAGKKHENAKRKKVYSNKVLSEQVKILQVKNMMLKTQLQELTLVVKDIAEKNELCSIRKESKG